ncbi:MAG: type II toxin-antitoxin system CcdA family antitoxin [Myxococcaceae bacterium]|nr:type II toxin-antitoxin system CcdA family antitoxin [Myxococcaceae bacterium]
MPRANRKATNLTVDAELVEEARRLDINLSQAFEAHLRELIRSRRAQAWLAENAAGIDAYNRFVESHGIWNEEERGW